MITSTLVGHVRKRNIDVTKMILDMMNKPHDLIGINEGRPGIDKTIWYGS